MALSTQLMPVIGTVSAAREPSAQGMDVLMRAYSAADTKLRLRYLKLACGLVMVLTLSGIGLDVVVYPNLIWQLLRIRLSCVVLTAGVGLLCTRELDMPQVWALGILWASIAQSSIGWMIYIADGANSPYYAGLNLVVVGIAVCLPWTFAETVLVCTITMVIYVAACTFHSGIETQRNFFVNNVSFLFFTDAICATTCLYTSRARFEDFRLRHELDLRNKELAELDRLKSEFFSNISHEFRTPLTLIISPVDEILRRGEDLPSKVREPLLMVRQNSLRLLKLITDLLELVRVEDKRATVKTERIDLAVLIPAMIDSVRHLALVKGLKIHMQSDVGSLVIEGDPGHIEKIVLNILTNAIKFTPNGGIITSRLKRQEQHAVLEIEDTGIGIAEKDLPYIFDRFRQADGSLTRKYQGIGIGLALAQELVQGHGGKLTAHSQLGKGTIFRVELPLCSQRAMPAEIVKDMVADDDPIADIYRRADRTMPTTAKSIMTQEIAPTGQGEFTILVVDDEPDMRKFLVSMLESEYRVIQAADGGAGLQMALKYSPSLALLDLMLPEMNGLDLCSAIKNDERTKRTRVVLLTARNDERSKLEALERGADDFLTKPFSSLEVKSRLANLLRAAQLEAELRQKNTDLQNTLKQLKDTETQLVQSEKMSALGSLSAGLLHEINNPLNFTLTALQLAQDAVPADDKDLEETLSDISQGMNRIKDIISDLRTFAYPASANKQENLDLIPVMDSAFRLVSHEINAIKVIREVPESLRIYGSKTQFIQVLVNLLLNAIKALSSGKNDGAEIKVSAQKDGGRVRVMVRDNGTGIKPDVLPKIFDPFFTTRPVGQGMGLGLSICHTIVKNHGGSITARSEEGRWTEIVFDFPSADEEA